MWPLLSLKDEGQIRAENSNSSMVLFFHKQIASRHEVPKSQGAVLSVGGNTPQNVTFIVAKDPVKFPTLSLSLKHVQPDAHICLRLNPAVLVFRSTNVANILNAFHYLYVI